MKSYATAHIVIILTLVFSHTALADRAPGDITKQEVVDIISTLEELHPRHYEIIHIMDGSLTEKDGFRHNHAKRISFFGPKNNRDTRRLIRSYTMLYSPEFGWFLQRTSHDAQGHFIEVSSQTKGRVFLR